MNRLNVNQMTFQKFGVTLTQLSYEKKRCHLKKLESHLKHGHFTVNFVTKFINLFENAEN